jgi:glycolate oxidase iron-sulfur subunit
MGWITADAPAELELAACVDCGLCLPHCPTFRLTGLEIASPRGRLAAMSAVAAGVVPVDAAFEDLMTFCLQCRACEAVCPSLVPFGRAMAGARIELTAQRPSRRRRVRHRFVGRVLASARLMKTAGSLAAAGQRLRADRWGPAMIRRLRGLRRIPLRPVTTRSGIHEPAGSAVATVALLSGCVMDPWFGAVHEATISVLVAAGYRVVVPPGQTCCGALAAHDGAADDTRRLAERNIAAFRAADFVVSDAAGCSAHLKDYAHWTDDGAAFSAKVRDVTEIVAAAITAGRLPVASRPTGTVAVQDPCHLRHAQRVFDEPRTILRAAGYEVIEIDPDGLCCGAAGMYTLLHPDVSAELGRRKAAQVTATGATIVASANPGCEMQLRSHLDAGHRIAHPVELYAAALEFI